MTPRYFGVGISNQAEALLGVCRSHGKARDEVEGLAALTSLATYGATMDSSDFNRLDVSSAGHSSSHSSSSSLESTIVMPMGVIAD